MKKFIFAVAFCCLALFLVNCSATDRKDTSALSHYIMGTMYDKLGDLNQAIEEYRKALKSDDSNAIIHLNLAASYIKNNELDKAIEELKVTVGLDPEAIEPHAILALIYSLQNKADLATSEYELALKNASKKEPKNIDIYKSLGLVYLQQRNFSAAENIYRSVLDLAPSDVQAHYYLGNIYFELKNKEAAERELKKAVELKPDFAEALNFLGYFYVEENKNLDQALSMIQKALEMDPNNGAYIDSLGWLNFKRGKIEEALKQLKQAAQLTEDPEIYKHLGEAYFATGDQENAKINWEKSLKLDPSQEEIKKKIEECKTLPQKSKN
ncbi:MAG: tetratricopeptide repeat protein [Candidatus Omnitrophica bacterium]|nr:tetratricopeptide repeat protein [Candidatus Omnitrophota bacterium]